MDSIQFLSGWFEEIMIEDELHIAAVDDLFLYFASKNIINIKGVRNVNGRWILIDGEHSINYGNNSYICAIRCVNKDKPYYIIKAIGEVAIKSVYLILNAKRIKLINEAFVNAINNFIMNESKLIEHGRYIADVVPIPIDGIYTLYDKKTENYLIAKKETDKKDNTSYVIDTVGDFYYTKLYAIINGDANRIRVVNCSIIANSINVRVLNKPPLTNMYNCQKTIVSYVVQAYNSKPNKNLTILISGLHGLGKSTVAFLIAQQIKIDLGVDPYLIKGFNVNSEEMQYHPIMGHYNPKNSCPIILLLDEFDIAMNRTKQSQTNSERNSNLNSISANKTNLNNFLDAINDESFLITVATTNMTISNINQQFDVYCRKGRFDKHFEMVDREMTNIIEPHI